MKKPNNSNGSPRSDVAGIDLFFTPAGVGDDILKGANVVVIDVLRSGASIATALANGANYVIPALSISAAIEISTQLSRDGVLLCGERDGRLIEGFDVGNSPLDYTRERVRARNLIFGSTNGSPAVTKAAVARNVVLCGFINLNAVVNALAEFDPVFPIVLLCAGKQSRFSIEDAVCGGRLIQRLRKKLRRVLVLNDAARTAVLLAEQWGENIESLLSESDHGKYLVEIEMQADLPACAADSSLDAVPILRDGRLILLKK